MEGERESERGRKSKRERATPPPGSHDRRNRYKTVNMADELTVRGVVSSTVLQIHPLPHPVTLNPAELLLLLLECVYVYQDPGRGSQTFNQAPIRRR